MDAYDEHLATEFMRITGIDDKQIVSSFLRISDGDLSRAIGRFMIEQGNTSNRQPPTARPRKQQSCVTKNSTESKGILGFPINVEDAEYHSPEPNNFDEAFLTEPEKHAIPEEKTQHLYGASNPLFGGSTNATSETTLYSKPFPIENLALNSNTVLFTTPQPPLSYHWNVPAPSFKDLNPFVNDTTSTYTVGMSRPFGRCNPVVRPPSPPPKPKKTPAKTCPKTSLRQRHNENNKDDSLEPMLISFDPDNSDAKDNGKGPKLQSPDVPNKQEINILILGETGVGKSTFINGFINYLMYSSLEDAVKGDLHTLIPTEFTMTDENFETVCVKTGNDVNEVLKAGQSATQSPQSYEFDIGGAKITLLDTPGIGDTRGIEQDKKNFEEILAHISQFKEIHGICILLKPNNARLTVTFRFCIIELLTYLHKDACNNIVFCFTNSRGTFYRPGDTMPALKHLLSETSNIDIRTSNETVYCFDSEAYRFLAAIKNNPPVGFSAKESECFASSWKESVNETKRLLEYISNLKPHATQDTLSLNSVREMILQLSRPLAEVGHNININKRILENETRQIENTRADRLALEKKLMTDTIALEIVPIDHPKTVCSNIACKRVHTHEGGFTSVEYPQVCHDRCKSGGIAADSIGSPRLMWCKAMKRNFLIPGMTCKHPKCGHSYKEHMHVYYESKQVVKKVEDKVVKNAVEKHLSDEEFKRRVVEGKRQLINEYEQELEEIERSSASFAYFLKTYAITPYNDAMEQYLDHLIKEEQEKAHKGSRSILDDLEKNKRSYINRKQVLEANMQTAYGASRITVDQINDCVVKLKSLKYSGASIEEALNCVKIAKTESNRENVVKISGNAQKAHWVIPAKFRDFGNKFMQNFYVGIENKNSRHSSETNRPTHTYRN